MSGGGSKGDHSSKSSGKKTGSDRKDQNAIRKNKAFQQLKRDMEQRARNRLKLVMATEAAF
jgi:hypothetical protein